MVGDNQFSDRAYPSNWDVDFADSVFFCFVVCSHVLHSSWDKFMLQIHPVCDAPEKIHNNQTLLTILLADLHLHFPLPWSSELNPPAGSRENLLLALYLFQNLPHYICKEKIHFPFRLGTRSTKLIDLANPGKRAISYYC